MITKRARIQRLRAEAELQATYEELGLHPIVPIKCLLDMDDIFQEAVRWETLQATPRILALLFAAKILEEGLR